MSNLPTPIRYLPEISDHIKKHFGDASFVLHEEKSSAMHVDVHVVLPNPTRPFFTLLTSGMSDLDMDVPDGLEELALGEVCLCLPSYWPLAIDRFEWRQPTYFWPLNLLHLAARYPHRQHTWLSLGHCLEVPKPNGAEVEFTGVLFVEPQSFPQGASQVHTDDGRIVNFLAMIPLLSDEMISVTRQGSKALAKQLFEAGVNELLNPSRASVA